MEMGVGIGLCENIYSFILSVIQCEPLSNDLIRLRLTWAYLFFLATISRSLKRYRYLFSRFFALPFPSRTFSTFINIPCFTILRLCDTIGIFYKVKVSISTEAWDELPCANTVKHGPMGSRGYSRLQFKVFCEYVYAKKNSAATFCILIWVNYFCLHIQLGMGVNRPSMGPTATVNICAYLDMFEVQQSVDLCNLFQTCHLLSSFITLLDKLQKSPRQMKNLF